jgi:hypothetical protein
VANSADLLQESLVASLRTEPLLIPAEELLHSAKTGDMQDQLLTSLARLLDPWQAIAEIDRRQYRELDNGLIDQFRAAMQNAVTGGATLADSESQILESFGLSKVGELRTAMQSHLGGPAELPEQDLAIYVPTGDRIQEDFHRALRQDLQALELNQEETDQPATTVIPSPGFVAPPARPADVGTDLRDVLGVAAPSASEGKRLAKLNPIPMLTAALEAVGLGGEAFGFVLRYGRYAPEGRKSEFLVGGLGLADLSKRLTAWLDAQGPLEGQVQVIDEGSGELKIYLLLPEGV